MNNNLDLTLALAISACRTLRTDALQASGHSHRVKPQRLLGAVDDKTVSKIVRTYSDCHAIAQDDADAKLSHAATQLSANGGAIIRGHLKLAARENLRNQTVKFNMIVALVLRLDFLFIAVFAFSAAASSSATWSSSCHYCLSSCVTLVFVSTFRKENPGQAI